MEKWEYLSVNVEWDSTANQWRVSGPWGTSLPRVTVLVRHLNPLGEQGWEAVGMAVVGHNMASFQKSGVTEVVTQWQSTGCRVLFKRRKP